MLAGGLSLRCRNVVGLALIASALAAAPAVAAVPDLPVPDTSAPSLPDVAPPQPSADSPRQSEVEVPSTPHVPAVEAPIGVTGPVPDSPGPVSGPSDSLSKNGSGSRVDLPEATGMGTGANGSDGSPREEAHQTTVPARGGEEGSARPGVSSPSGGAGSLEPAKVAPALLAYVWPAIALDPAELFRALQGRWDVVTSLLVTGAPDLLSGLAEVGGVDRAGESSEPPANVDPTPGDSRSFSPASGGEIPILLFIAFCAALALLIYTLKREFRSMHRRPL